MKKVVLTAFIFFILLSSTYAIGLRAVKLNNEIFFQPYFEGTYHISIVPTNEEPMDMEVYVADSSDDGTTTNLSRYFTLSNTIFRRVKIHEDPTFSVTVNLPAKIKEPGTHKVRVGARELPKNQGGLAVRTSVESLFFIQVPFEGKYVKFHITPQNINIGEDMPVDVYFTAQGDQKINKIYAVLEILDSNGNFVQEIKTETFSLVTNENKEIKLMLPTKSLSAGKYFIRGTVHYDGESDIVTEEARIGKLDFNILNQTNVLIAGKINKIFVDIESLWADVVENVYADVTVVKATGEELTIKTLPMNFKGFERFELEGFFDATSFEPGEYKMIIVIHFGNNKKTKETTVTVQKESLRLPEFNTSLNQVLFTIIFAIILIINIILFIILIKKKDKHENEIKPQ